MKPIILSKKNGTIRCKTKNMTNLMKTDLFLNNYVSPLVIDLTMLYILTFFFSELDGIIYGIKVKFSPYLSHI